MGDLGWEPVRDLVRADRRGALVTVVAGQGLGAKLLVTPDAVEGSLGDPALDEEATRIARELLPGEEAAVRELDGREVFFDVYAPQPRLLIVGAVDFAAALARLARFTGFKVSVIDARERFATTERIPEADEVVVAWPQEYLADHPPDDATYAAVLTHEPRFDDPTLSALLRSPVAYIGAMGSRRAHAERLERLREAGFGDDDIARISGPIGLDIGAKSPEETAVSILAEVIAARHGRRGGPLSERPHRPRPLHPGAGRAVGDRSAAWSRQLLKPRRLDQSPARPWLRCCVPRCGRHPARRGWGRRRCPVGAGCSWRRRRCSRPRWRRDARKPLAVRHFQPWRQGCS
jgi:xanthine dehydrogenase accessory factor